MIGMEDKRENYQNCSTVVNYDKQHAVWLSGNTYTSGPVSTEMSNHLRAGTPCWYVISHLGRFSLLPSEGH